jgi:hypothetical protein
MPVWFPLLYLFSRKVHITETTQIAFVARARRYLQQTLDIDIVVQCKGQYVPGISNRRLELG